MAVSLAGAVVARPLAPGARLVAIDALRGLAIVAMALDHAAAAAHVSLQAEWYSGTVHTLNRIPSLALGLFTNLAAPTFWFLAGTSVWLYSSARRHQGQAEWQTTRFYLIRATVLAALDFSVAWLAWSGTTPYTHILLSLAVTLALLGAARLLPYPVLAVIAGAWLVGYQIALPALVGQLTDGANATYAQALAYYFSYETVPASEFSILGWGSLMFLGFVFGRFARAPRMRQWTTWLGISALMLAAWFGLRLLGRFGDLASYSNDLPLPYFVIMNKTPPALTFLLFNLGLAAFLYGLLQAQEGVLHRPPLLWVVWMGQVSLFAFAAHLVIYGMLGRVALLIPVLHLLPGSVLATGSWLVGLALLIPLAKSYRTLRRSRPASFLRYI